MTKIVRFETPAGKTGYGCLHGDDRVTRLDGELFSPYSDASAGPSWRDSGEPIEVARLLAPVVPSDLFCIGLNYREHAAEGGKPIPDHPVVFGKSAGSVQRPGGPIELPRTLRSDRVDYEAELVVIIGRPCRNATPETAFDYVLGYTCGNDVSARDWQKHGGGGQWRRGKMFDTFAPMGPCLVTHGPGDDAIADPQSLGVKTLLNDEVMQDGHTGDMIFPVAELIAFLSGSTTLAAGTAIFTGTPAGVGFARKPPVWLQPGDEVTIEIDRIGRLTNPVVEEIRVDDSG
ncbi:MAG: fumarylacetoacetate hydrolase family protein [Planctomycetota bacterium]